MEMCSQIMADARLVREGAGEQKPDIQVARVYATVANNDLMDRVFDWCAENDLDEFPITFSGLKSEGN